MLLSACHRDEKPHGIIDTATMVSFLTEAHLIEGYVDAANRVNADSAIFYAECAYNSLYAKYGISPNEYDSSIVYYVHHPELMEDIYSRVVENLRSLQP